jgi:hypothetical protein
MPSVFIGVHLLLKNSCPPDLIHRIGIAALDVIEHLNILAVKDPND